MDVQHRRGTSRLGDRVFDWRPAVHRGAERLGIADRTGACRPLAGWDAAPRLVAVRVLAAGGTAVRAFVWLLLAASAVLAQTASVERGAQLYRTNCAAPYCHGPEGSAGRAPKLIGHTHSINSMFKVITWGIPGTGMPEFTTRLKSEEIADIVAYVMTMRGTGP